MDKFNDIIQEFLIKGKKIESNFAKDLLNECGGEIKASSKYEDISKHIVRLQEQQMGVLLQEYRMKFYFQKHRDF